jgi:hypothetical protein
VGLVVGDFANLRIEARVIDTMEKKKEETGN